MIKHLKAHILLLGLMLSSSLAAQQNLTLFLMHDVPQANFVNPAVSYNCNWIVGVPALASFDTNYNNTAFSVDDVLKSKSGTDSLYFDFNKVVNDFSDTELLTSSIHYTPLYAGFWLKNNWLTFSITESVTTFNTIPKEAAELAWYGNTKFVGSEASLEGIRANGYHHREYALGLSRSVSDKLTLGIHTKLLFGKGSVYTPETDGGIRTNSRNFGLIVDLDTEVKTSFPIDVEIDDEGFVSDISMQDDIDWMGYMMNRKNLGLGFDFGFIYEYDELTTISGSILNLGIISWKTNVNQFKSNGEFEYTGTDSSTDFNNSDYVSELRDSLRHQFIPVPEANSFTSRLTPEMYIGATRELNKHLNAGAVFYSRFLRNKVQPALTLSANTQAYKRFNASVSYTAINGDFFNIGAGVGLKLGVVHLHAMADNAFGFFNLSKQRNLNLRFGLSIVPRCDEQKRKEATSNNGISAMPCYHSPYKGDKKKRK